MLIRRLFALPVFFAATAVAAAASAQAPPPSDPPPSSPSPAPAPATALDASVIVEIDSGDANVTLDGQPIEGALSGKRLPVSAGHHVVEAHVAGRPPIRREVDVSAGGTTGVVLHVVPLAADAIGYDAPEGQGPLPPDHGSPRIPLILAGAGVSIVALGLGVGFNLLATSNSNDAVAQQTAIGRAGGTTSICHGPASGFAQACTALHDELVARDRNADIAVAAYATAGVAAAATIAYAVWSIPKEERHQRWTSSLRPAPIVGANTGGIAVLGVF
jgi:hypothetical protein